MKKLTVRDCKSQYFPIAEHPGSGSYAPQHQPVPRRENFLITTRPDTSCTLGVQLRHCRLDSPPQLLRVQAVTGRGYTRIDGDIRNVLSLEVAARGDAEMILYEG